MLPFMPGSPWWSLSFRFPHQNPVHASPFPIRATCPTHLILLGFITNKRVGVFRNIIGVFKKRRPVPLVAQSNA
jgi:hypothetical protein